MPTRTLKALAAVVALLLLPAVLPALADEYQKGLQKFERKRYKSASKHFVKALRKDPKNVDAWVFLGDCYIHRREHNKAVGAYEEAAELRPDDAEIRYKLGSSYDLAMSVDKAFEQYKILRKMDAEMARKLYRQIFNE